MTTRAYTDGACSGNPGPGGWAFVVDDGPWASGAEAMTTNQRMEITAAFEAVRRVSGPLEIVSDSTYVVNCFVQRWWEGWLKRGWKNSNRQPVANRDLWEPFIDLVNRRGDVKFVWVKGHNGDRMNEAADRLATDASAHQRGRSGVRFDESVLSGAADDAQVQPEIGDGPVVVVTGHRPTELGGWDLANPVADSLRRQLAEILRAKKQVDPQVSVATGLGLGAEMLAAEAALMANVPYTAVIAFEGIDERWPPATRRRFGQLLESAARVEIVGDVPVGKDAFAAAMRKRDEWLARNGTEAIMIWNRHDPILGRAHDRFDRAFEGGVWVIEPPTDG